MKTRTFIGALTLAVGLILASFAPAAARLDLDGPPTEYQADIVDILVENDGFSTLVAAAQSAGLVGALQADGPYTVFAPTNEAFAALLADLGMTADELLADTDLLTSVLLYHVAPGEYFSRDLLTTDSLTMLDGSMAHIATTGSSVYIDGAQVTNADINVSNGVIHVIDTVILPPAIADPAELDANIVEAAIATEGFSTLVAAVQAAGLVDTLSGEGPYTVFAPTDAAFAALLDDLGMTAGELLANTDLLTSVLLYHVAPGEYFAADLMTRDYLQMADGNIVGISGGNGVMVNDANVVTANLNVSNGVIHVIDTVLLPSTAPLQAPAVEYDADIVDIALENEGFSTLVAALQAAGLVETLQGEGPYTVFAPTNAAFEKLFAETGMTPEELLSNQELLTDVLLYHVAPGESFAKDLAANNTVMMANGDLAVFSIQNGQAMINGASISNADINVSNGVIHVIDEVILPPSD